MKNFGRSQNKGSYIPKNKKGSKLYRDTRINPKPSLSLVIKFLKKMKCQVGLKATARGGPTLDERLLLNDFDKAINAVIAQQKKLISSGILESTHCFISNHNGIIELCCSGMKYMIEHGWVEIERRRGKIYFKIPVTGGKRPTGLYMHYCIVCRADIYPKPKRREK